MRFASIAGMPDDSNLNPAWSTVEESLDEALSESMPVTDALPVDFVLIDVEDELPARRRWPWIAAIGGALAAGLVIALVVRARR